MENIVRKYLDEDIGTEDVTTNAIVPRGHRSKARMVAKEDGVIAGHSYAKQVFKELDNRLKYTEEVKDGEYAKKGTVIAFIEGKTRAILTGERVALNILQRLSGIATMTRRFVEAVKGTEARILDTRKTSPGHRTMEKYAVRMGGGVNHRDTLGEMALIKENHIAVAGSIKAAVDKIRRYTPVPIEVEVRNMAELKEALKTDVERIMFDNWDIESMKKGVSLVKGTAPIEASGNMTLERVGEVARTGVDFISVGAITHSFKSLDISLLHEIFFK